MWLATLWLYSTFIIEYNSTLYVGLQLKQNGRPYKAMVRTVSKSRKEAFLKLQKVSSLHYHAFYDELYLSGVQNHTEACKLKLAKVPFCTSFFLSFFLSSLFRRGSASIVRATAFIFGRSTPLGTN